MKRYPYCLHVVSSTLVLLLGTVVQTWAGPAVSQAVGLKHAVVDEFGEPLRGNEPAAAAMGLPFVEGDVVQILLATDNIVYPPDAAGQPDPRNVVLTTTRIGRGTSPLRANPAKFGTAVSPRPGGNSQIFVRVFNAPSLEEASFYGDSQLFKVRSWDNEVFMAEVAATTVPLDDADDDGDGLSNSWEKSYGTDAKGSDSDHDGVKDGDEIAAGTDALDGQSFFAVSRFGQGSRRDVVLSWDSVAGRTYRVEHASEPVAGAMDFREVAVVVGGGKREEYVVTAALAGDHGFYRVCVAP